jgi:hypothetical protein
MRTIILSSVLALSLLTAACGDDDDASCAKVVDHTISLVPEEFKSQMGDKKEMIEKCEKESTPEARECALKAKTMEDLMQCPRGK